jgi:hypothetical protein
MLADRGVPLIPVDYDRDFLEDLPTAILMRQILGPVAQFEKSAPGGQATRSPPAQAPEDKPLQGSELRAESRSEARPGASRRRAAALRQIDLGAFLSPSGKHYSTSSVAAMVRPALDAH